MSSLQMDKTWIAGAGAAVLAGAAWRLWSGPGASSEAAPKAAEHGVYPPLSAEDVARPKFAIIGGSGVTVQGSEFFSFRTPFGVLLKISFMDSGKKVLLVNRHFCTALGADGASTYAPPHVVDFKCIMWALKELNVAAIAAIGSTGTLRPDAVPIASFVMPDDFYCTLPIATTFWPHRTGLFFADKSKGELGKMHFAPAIEGDELGARWAKLRVGVQQALHPVLGEHAERVKLARGQTAESWPKLAKADGDDGEGMVYLMTNGPRFETRAEIRQYAKCGHVVGMTCASEWTLASELDMPYVLVCAVDNKANGLSTHPKGPAQEYLDNKKAIGEVTAGVVSRLTAYLTALDPASV